MTSTSLYKCYVSVLFISIVWYEQSCPGKLTHGRIDEAPPALPNGKLSVAKTKVGQARIGRAAPTLEKNKTFISWHFQHDKTFFR